MYTYILVDSLDDDAQFYTPFSLFLFSHANLINSIEWPAKQFPRLRRNPVAVISIPFNFRGIQLDNPFRFLFEINTLPPSPPVHSLFITFHLVKIHMANEWGGLLHHTM